MNNTDTYISTNFYLSAYLVASGIDLQAYRKTKEGLTLFVFPNSHKLQQHVNNYFSTGAVAHPLKYGNALRNLKSVIHKNDTEIYAT